MMNRQCFSTNDVTGWGRIRQITNKQDSIIFKRGRHHIRKVFREGSGLGHGPCPTDRIWVDKDVEG